MEEGEDEGGCDREQNLEEKGRCDEDQQLKDVGLQGDDMEGRGVYIEEDIDQRHFSQVLSIMDCDS